MLTAAVASADATNNAYLKGCLEQTGLVGSVREWIVTQEGHPIPEQMIPDVVLLDVSQDEAVHFNFATYLRRLRPTVRIIACSAQQRLDPDLLLQAMRSGVQEFLNKPISPAGLRETLTRFVRDRGISEPRGTEKLILVMGAKGGVGATTVAVHLGIEMYRATRKRVVLLDFARPLGHAALVLDLQPSFSLRDAVENLDRLDGHFFGGLLSHHKSGLEVLAGTSHPEEWHQISAPALTRVLGVAQSSANVVVVDCGSQYTDEWSSILRAAHSILLLAEANVPSLWSLQRQVSALSGLGISAERLRVVINRWRRVDEEALRTVEKNLRRPVFARLPNDYRQVSTALNEGVPVSGNHNNLLASRFQQLALQLLGTAPRSPEKRSGLSHIFSFSMSR